jgi:hypothetical protein
MKAQRLMGVVLTTGLVILVAAAALLGSIPGVGARVAAADSVRHFSLLAETMQPVDSTIEYDSNSAFLTTIQDSGLSGPASYIGQLDLPDGARIVGARCFGLDTDPMGEFYFRLYRYNLWTEPVWSGVTDFAHSDVPFSEGKVVVEAAVEPEAAFVDNAEFSYGIFLVLPTSQSGELAVLRCMVDTTYPISLPLVQRN